jgi:hypothetical protein
MSKKKKIMPSQYSLACEMGIILTSHLSMPILKVRVFILLGLVK